MTGLSDNEATLPTVTAEALDWLTRLSSGEATTADAHDLALWRARSPAHEAAFREVAAFRRLARALPPADATPRPAARGGPPVISRRAALAGGGALAASAAGLMATHPPLGLWPSLAELTADHRTGPGQRYAFAPTAGVKVEMNTRTSVSLTDGGVRLLDGEAYVTVAGPAPRFTVATADGLVTARQPARFNVRAIDQRLCVVCVAGEVEGRRGGRAAAVGAGEQAVFIARDAPQLTRADLDQALAWRRGLLIFDGTALSEVIAEINRYRPGRIILADSAIGARPVNGVFHTAQIENAVDQIQQLLGVRLTRWPGGVVLVG